MRFKHRYCCIKCFPSIMNHFKAAEDNYIIVSFSILDTKKATSMRSLWRYVAQLFPLMKEHIDIKVWGSKYKYSFVSYVKLKPYNLSIMYPFKLFKIVSLKRYFANGICKVIGQWSKTFNSTEGVFN